MTPSPPSHSELEHQRGLLSAPIGSKGSGAKLAQVAAMVGSDEFKLVSIRPVSLPFYAAYWSNRECL